LSPQKFLGLPGPCPMTSPRCCGQNSFRPPLSNFFRTSTQPYPTRGYSLLLVSNTEHQVITFQHQYLKIILSVCHPSTHLVQTQFTPPSYVRARQLEPLIPWRTPHNSYPLNVLISHTNDLLFSQLCINPTKLSKPEIPHPSEPLAYTSQPWVSTTPFRRLWRVSLTSTGASATTNLMPSSAHSLARTQEHHELTYPFSF
jgi:hypothetical protein